MRRLTRNVPMVVCVGVLCLATTLLLKGDEPEQFSDWETPAWLGNVVNTAAGDFLPFISKDGLSLYFSSSRPGGFGGFDIYVSHRISLDDPWELPQNLGPTVNSTANDGRPAISPDGHLLFFASTRAGGFGGNDIWVSRRKDKRDDFGWQEPQNLGSGVNTSANEASPSVFEDEASGRLTLYFDSNRPGGFGPFTSDGALNGNDIYASVLQDDETFGPATLVAELSTPSTDRQPFVRRDGLEVFLTSDRPLVGCPAVGCQLDLWVATRKSTSSPWSTPVSLGPTVNDSTFSDAGAALSFDGLTMYFQSARNGGLGVYDLWMTTRSKLKKLKAD